MLYVLALTVVCTKRPFTISCFTPRLAFISIESSLVSLVKAQPCIRGPLDLVYLPAIPPRVSGTFVITFPEIQKREFAHFFANSESTSIIT